jgi:hypothetical protein
MTISPVTSKQWYNSEQTGWFNQMRVKGEAEFMATYTAKSRGRCPHCLTVVRFEAAEPPIRRLGDDSSYSKFIVAGPKEELYLHAVVCPECGQLILSVETGQSDGHTFYPQKEFVIWPSRSTRPPVPPEVPTGIASDYNEAALVLHLSPKASAALSRRCLQSVLRDGAGANQRDLSQQIDAVIPQLPSYISTSIDAIRNIGNFAAHPMKEQASGLILDVEPGEAEWNLDVLDLLFDHYYVQPALAQKKKDALNAKLSAANKPPMK